MAFLILTALSVIAADQISKILIFKYFPLGVSFPLIKNIVYITPTHNTGIAFSLLKGLNSIFFIIISVIAIGLILYLLIAKAYKGLLRAGLVLILSGAIGNLIDRALYGYVFDFIDLRVWPVFNIADSCITIGTVLIVWCICFQSYLK